MINIGRMTTAQETIYVEGIAKTQTVSSMTPYWVNPDHIVSMQPAYYNMVKCWMVTLSTGEKIPTKNDITLLL